ncbi:MAG TPA: hypothetical protein DCE41_13260 [Cytophagales bacterium]|nr:hypothetical protein [Cytophagales bacterium]HAA20417.1 hypothetical protein [Cytophagales bacterium]
MVIIDTVVDTQYAQFQKERAEIAKKLRELRVVHLQQAIESLWWNAAPQSLPNLDASLRVDWLLYNLSLQRRARLAAQRRTDVSQRNKWHYSLAFQQGFYRLPHQEPKINMPWWNEYVLRGQVNYDLLGHYGQVYAGLGIGYRSQRAEHVFDPVSYVSGFTAIGGPDNEELAFLHVMDEWDPFKKWHYFLDMPVGLSFNTKWARVEAGVNWQHRVTRHNSETLWERNWQGQVALLGYIGDHFEVGVRGHLDLTPYLDVTVSGFSRAPELQVPVITYREGVHLVVGFRF